MGFRYYKYSVKAFMHSEYLTIKSLETASHLKFLSHFNNGRSYIKLPFIIKRTCVLESAHFTYIFKKISLSRYYSLDYRWEN